MRYKNCQKKIICFHTLLITISIFCWAYLAHEVLAEISHILHLKLKLYLTQNENQNNFKVTNFNGKKINWNEKKNEKRLNGFIFLTSHSTRLTNPRFAPASNWKNYMIFVTLSWQIDIHPVLNLPSNLQSLKFGTKG